MTVACGLPLGGILSLEHAVGVLHDPLRAGVAVALRLGAVAALQVGDEVRLGCHRGESLAIYASDETVGGLLAHRDAADAGLDAGDVALAAALRAAVDDHEVVVHLVEDLLATGALRVVAASAASECPLDATDPWTLERANETVIGRLIRLALHSDNMQTSVALLEHLAVQFLVLVRECDAVEPVLGGCELAFAIDSLSDGVSRVIQSVQVAAVVGGSALCVDSGGAADSDSAGAGPASLDLGRWELVLDCATFGALLLLERS